MSGGRSVSRAPSARTRSRLDAGGCCAGLMILSGLALAGVTLPGGGGCAVPAARAAFLAFTAASLLAVRDWCAGRVQGAMLACLMAGLAA